MKRYAQSLKNNSKAFHALINTALWEAGVYANTHHDDIIITSNSFDEHLSHIRHVLDRLRLANLTARASNTQFARKETKCLAFVMGNGRIAPDLNKRQLKISQFALRRNQFWRFWGHGLLPSTH